MEEHDPSSREQMPLSDDAKRFILFSLENSRTVRAGSHTIGDGIFFVDSGPSVIFWDILSDDMKQDHGIVFKAFVHGHARVEDLPDQFRRDRNFFLEAVREKADCWYDLPEEYKIDPEFVRSFRSFSGDSLVGEVFEAIPTLRHDRDIWDTIIASENCTIDLAPNSILSDGELMMKACEKDIWLLRKVSGSLARDKDFLQKVIDMDPEALRHLSNDAQIQFPELVIDNLKPFLAVQSNRISGDLLEYIAPDVRTNPSFIEKWFTLGGRFLPRYFPESMRDEEQIFLWLAKHCIIMSSFQNASDRLKGDRDFVSRLIELQPYAYFDASDDIQQDTAFQSKTLAIGNSHIAEEYITRLRETNVGEERIETFSTFLQQKLDWHETFMTSILLGISLPADPSRCSLTILNQGVETSLVYKKLIAQYAGVPTQIYFLVYTFALRNLRRAQQQLDHESNVSGNDDN